MNTLNRNLWKVLLLATLFGVATPLDADDSELTYYQHIEPILKRSCVACHRAGQSEGNLNLESYESLMRGGDSGAILPLDAVDQSELLARITATDDQRMPPMPNSAGAPALTETEIALVQRWIRMGAKVGAPNGKRSMAWQPIPASLQPILAVAANPDDQWLFCGRANIVYGYRVDHEANVVESVVLRDTADQPTHLDLVQSMACSPDGDWIATGAFREIKVWRRQVAPMTDLPGLYQRMVSCTARRSDGAQLAMGRADGTIDLVDSSSNQVIRTLVGSSASVVALSWSWDQSRLFSLDNQGLLTAWDLASPEVNVPAGSSTSGSHVIQTQVEPGSRSLVPLAEQEVVELTGSGELRRWRAQSSESDGNRWVSESLVIPGDGTRIQSVTSIEPGMLLVAREHGSLVWFDVPGNQVVRECSHGSEIRDVAVSNDRTRIATAGVDGTIKVWNHSDAQLVQTMQGDWLTNKTIERLERESRRKQLSVDRLTAKQPEFEKAVAAEKEAQKKFEDALEKASTNLTAKSQATEQAKSVLDEHDKQIAELQSQMEEAAKRIEQLRSERDAKVAVLQKAEKEQLDAMENHRNAEQALANARESVERAEKAIPNLLQHVDQAKARVELANRAIAESQRAAQMTLVPVTRVTFSQQDRVVIAAFDDLDLRSYRIADGRQLDRWTGLQSTPTQLFATQDGLLIASSANQASLAWSTHGIWKLHLVVGSPESDLFPDRITALDFSPDGKKLVVGSGTPSRTGDWFLVDTASGAITQKSELAHSDTILAVAFSPDGTQFATCGADKLAKVWNSDDGKLMQTLEGHTHHVLALAWQDDGMTIATGSADNSIKIWDVESGESRRTIGGFSKEVTGLRFVGTSSLILSSCADAQVRLHDSSNGNGIRGFGGSPDFLYSLATLLKEQWVVAGGQDGTLRVWNIENAQLVRQVR